MGEMGKFGKESTKKEKGKNRGFLRRGVAKFERVVVKEILG
jgi:hypothetical protein